MACQKCGYRDKKEVKKFDQPVCKICNTFAPNNEKKFNKYIGEKLDWKVLETFRKNHTSVGDNLKKAMHEKAKEGKIVTRAPMGYSVTEGKLLPNQDASKIHSLFRVFLEKDYSLNSLSKNYGLSVNGLKKVLSNRTYLGEVKFAGTINKGNHNSIISPEIFYAVQRKLKEKMRS